MERMEGKIKDIEVGGRKSSSGGSEGSAICALGFGENRGLEENKLTGVVLTDRSEYRLSLRS